MTWHILLYHLWVLSKLKCLGNISLCQLTQHSSNEIYICDFLFITLWIPLIFGSLCCCILVYFIKSQLYFFVKLSLIICLKVQGLSSFRCFVHFPTLGPDGPNFRAEFNPPQFRNFCRAQVFIFSRHSSFLVLTTALWERSIIAPGLLCLRLPPYWLEIVQCLLGSCFNFPPKKCRQTFIILLILFVLSNHNHGKTHQKSFFFFYYLFLKLYALSTRA